METHPMKYLKWSIGIVVVVGLYLAIAAVVNARMEWILPRIFFGILSLTFLLHVCTPPRSWTSHADDFWGVNTPRIDYRGGIIFLGIATICMGLIAWT
jgi:hypothetical protein